MKFTAEEVMEWFENRAGCSPDHRGLGLEAYWKRRVLELIDTERGCPCTELSVDILYDTNIDLEHQAEEDAPWTPFHAIPCHCGYKWRGHMRRSRLQTVTLLPPRPHPELQKLGSSRIYENKIN